MNIIGNVFAVLFLMFALWLICFFITLNPMWWFESILGRIIAIMLTGGIISAAIKTFNE